ncbi:hypothetical protein [Streptomyces olivochromogenes]|uniref:hypothetical protein n=1 Tax=Streptomyces olivochromogenes TaxID=1963 RepID=UPI003674281A
MAWPVFPAAVNRTSRLRAFAPGTVALVAAISFGALQRNLLPYAGVSGATSKRPASASDATAWA